MPSLNDLQINDNPFKVYADKPEMGDEVKDGSIKSYRKEQYTLIPQQSGALTLPEMSIAWWDTAKQEKVITRIPARILQVLPVPASTLESMAASAGASALTASESQAVVIQRDPLLYVLIAGLAMLLFAAIFWGISLQKKIVRLTEKPADLKKADKRDEKYPPYSPFDAEKKPPTDNKKEKLPDLNPT
jgi:hypothetical protein